MTFQASLCAVLSHSAVYFSRSEQWPFDGPEPRNDGKDTASTDETEDNSQVAGDFGTGSSGLIAGSGSAAAGQAGSVFSRGSIGAGRGSITTIETSDPEVTESALASNTDVTTAALTANGLVTADGDAVASDALNDLSDTANEAIESSVQTTQSDASFGEAALNAAANAEANSETALEGLGTEAETNATNALAAAQNETLAGVTPAQAFQSEQPTTPGNLTSSSIATWVTIIAGILAIYFYLKGRKA